MWGQISVDEQLGQPLYLPVELPTGDYYGGHRPGAGLFGESLVAVDLQTGKRKWHYQLVHHGIWDMDIPCAPILADITVERPHRQSRGAAHQAGASCMCSIASPGKPIWPIEERPVPQGDVPGEWYSPTQPFPTKPPAYDRQGVCLDDLIDFTPELHEEAVKLVSQLSDRTVVYAAGGQQAGRTVWRRSRLPGSLGGANWPGGSFDPETHTVYVFSQTRSRHLLGLVPPTRCEGIRHELRSGQRPPRRARVKQRQPPAWRAGRGPEPPCLTRRTSAPAAQAAST